MGEARMGVRRLGCALAAVLCVLALPPLAAHATSGTTYTWVGNSQGSGGDNHSWSDSENWNPVGVPGDGDSVIIEQPSAGDCFAHVDSTPTVELVDFTLEENPALCTTSVSGGALSISGSFSWNGGTLSSPTTIESSASGQISGSNQRLNALTQELDVAGRLTLDGLSSPGELQILHGQELHLEDGAVLSSSGSNEVDGSACCTDPAKVVNDGTISIGGNTLTLGTLELDQNAVLATSANGELLTSAGPVTTGTTGAYTGDGRWLLTGASQARFSGTQTLGSGFHLELGGVTSTSSSSLAGTVTFAGTGTFDWTGGVIQAGLTIAHGVTVEVAGAHTGGGGRVLSGHDYSAGGAGVPVTLTNHGIVTLTDGATVSTASQAHLVNASDGVVNIAPGTSFASEECCATPDRLTNSGSVHVGSGGGSDPAVVSGVAYESSGTTTIASGKVLRLTGGAPNKLAAGTVGGGGNLSVTGPTAVSGTLDVKANTRLVLGDHGSLDGTAVLSGAGAMNWTGGSVSGAVTVSLAGGLAVSGQNTKAIANIGGGSTPSKLTLKVATMVAAGTASAHDEIDVGSSVLVNTSVLDAGAFSEFANGTVSNRGTFSIHSGKVFARSFEQPKGHKIALDIAKTKSGSITSIGSVVLHGALAVRNAFVPHVGDKVTVVKAPTLTDSLNCVDSTGKGTSGSSAGHWVNTHTGTKVVLVWHRGAAASC